MVSHVYVLVWNILAQLMGGNPEVRAVRLGAAQHTCCERTSRRDARLSSLEATRLERCWACSCSDAAVSRWNRGSGQGSSDAADVIQMRQHGVARVAATCSPQTRP